MSLRAGRSTQWILFCTLGLFCLAAAPGVAQPRSIASVPRALGQADDLGLIDSRTPLNVTVWLNLQDRAGFDQRVAALYTPGSPSYHHWLSASDLLAYAPGPAGQLAVRQQLQASGLSVTVDESNPFLLRASGEASQVQAAFNTSIHSFQKQGVAFHANVTEAHLDGDAASLVLSVSGLHSLPMQPLYARAVEPRTGKPRPPVPLAAVTADAAGLPAYFTNHCFQPPSQFTFGQPGQVPVGVYYGNVYNPGNRTCAYTAQQMQSIYGLPAIYKAGLTGAGQTIVIVDGYGSPTIRTDANQFSALNGLAPLDASTLRVLYPGGMPLNPRLGQGWIREVSLDVEWAHAIAPAAKIVLLAAASGENQDLQYAIQYAVLHRLGGVISNSYGIPEAELGAADLDTYNLVVEQAAALGISVNFASGDKSDLGMGTPAGAAMTPADSPYGTAVGGTSIGVPGGAGNAKEAGWGNNQSVLAYTALQAANPPLNYGNVGGAGGGSSTYFAKPAWQRALSGQFRQGPDAALAADPYTGAVLVLTDPNYGPVIESTGGTSLATPMFSALWALANQKAGHFLGQAAPLLSKLPASALHDIIPVSSPTNVTGMVFEDTGASFYTAAALASPLQDTTGFFSTIWPVNGEYVNLTFGTDGSLHTARGWDNVTGFGTPNGLDFITAAARE